MARALRRPNGYGTIVKRGGRRRNPYEIRITTGFETYLDKDGNLKTKQVQRSIGSFPDYASAALALAIYNNDPYDPAMKKITLEQVFNEVMKEKEGLAKSTLSSYRATWNKMEKLQKKPIAKLTLADLQSVIDCCESHTMQPLVLNLFSTLFTWATERKIVSDNPAKLLKLTAEKKEARKGQPYTSDELRKIWKNLHKIKNADIILFQVYTGTRIGELLALKKEDLHLEERWLAIHGTKTANADRVVPIRKELVPLFRSRMSTGNNTPFVFINEIGKKINSKTFIGKNFPKIVAQLEIGEHTTHDARHTFVSRADESGISQTALKVIVGHSLQGVTGKVYTHRELSSLIEEMDKISFF